MDRKSERVTDIRISAAIEKQLQTGRIFHVELVVHGVALHPVFRRPGQQQFQTFIVAKLRGVIEGFLVSFDDCAAVEKQFCQGRTIGNAARAVQSGFALDSAAPIDVWIGAVVEQNPSAADKSAGPAALEPQIS